MSPGKISEKVVADRLAWIEEMLVGIEALPLGSPASFARDSRNVAAAESYLRRSLEAVLDMGRHVLAKAFGIAVSEYKGIPQCLQEVGVLTEEEALLLREMAGYRNRLVHFYDEVSTDELYNICIDQVEDVRRLAYCLRDWVADHPEKVDRTL